MQTDRTMRSAADTTEITAVQEQLWSLRASLAYTQAEAARAGAFPYNP